MGRQKPESIQVPNRITDNKCMEVNQEWAGYAKTGLETNQFQKIKDQTLFFLPTLVLIISLH